MTEKIHLIQHWIEFSFLLVLWLLSDEHKKIEKNTKLKDFKYSRYNYQLEYNLYCASTNTRAKGFDNPVVVDTKKGIETILAKVEEKDLISDLIQDANTSKCRFYKCLGVTFHMYEMNTPNGRSNELPSYFKQGSNEKALMKYENYDDNFCFWRCLAFCLKQLKTREILRRE